MPAKEASRGNNHRIIDMTVRDHVATLTLNDPASRNSLSREMMTQLQENLDAIAADKNIHVLILRAEGPVFSSGHNLREVQGMARDETLAELFDQCSKMMQAIVHLPQPVIARIDGMVTAAGTQLVASCDLAYASENSKFATSGINFGLFCSTPGVALGRNVSPKHAMEMLLSGDFINANRAREIGLINVALPADKLDAHIHTMAQNIAAKSPVVVKMGKAAFYQQLSLPLDEAYSLTSGVMVENMRTHDAAEGLTAFFEKRTPEWRGE
ncbi:MAG: enoyl-CoA hydratase [Sneathiella sp.]|jgi:enoyl-CoA hydratase/carnithine racemase|uniref:enoyl-CoA hydratase n=1 Tax=Sneathiella sp. TaxID=1964365 RepID=UPI000C650F28|nr:enoyl-CoA hydratase [Sneathiella sp.]MAL80038.1 enoyl-CoA hydratase [Sneathiella sp.]